MPTALMPCGMSTAGMASLATSAQYYWALASRGSVAAAVSRGTSSVCEQGTDPRTEVPGIALIAGSALSQKGVAT